MKNLLLVIILFSIGHILIWFQTNGQFIWKWFERNPLLLSIVFGTTISYFFIYATKYSYEYFNGLIWPIKFIGFSIGILIYYILTYYFMSEGLTLKTIICLLLSLIIIFIQLFK